MLTTKDKALIRAFYEWGKTLDEARDMWETIFDDYEERLGAKLDIPKLANEIVKLTPQGVYREECRRFFDRKQYALIASMIMGIPLPSSTNSGLMTGSAGLFSNNGMMSIKGETGEWSAAVDSKWWRPIETEEWDLDDKEVDDSATKLRARIGGWLKETADPEIIEARDEQGKAVWKSRIK